MSAEWFREGCLRGNARELIRRLIGIPQVRDDWYSVAKYGIVPGNRGDPRSRGQNPDQI
jgi:hypothetical protein